MKSDPARPRPSSKSLNPSERSSRSQASIWTVGLQRVLQGQISAPKAALELLRRARVKLDRSRERSLIEKISSKPVQLTSDFQKQSPAKLLEHFRNRTNARFFAGFESDKGSISELQARLFPKETAALVEAASQIVRRHRWSLMGFGERDFGKPIDWNRDPLSGRQWPLSFHSDVVLWHNDGSDIRVLWELNRLGHFITLGRAYAQTGREEFAEEFFTQLEDWDEQNPLGRGANWRCAMEVALRAMNLIAAFVLFRHSPALNERRIMLLLALFEKHGAHIRRNLEFSYIATGNHYLSDLVGLLWLALMLPELSAAREWRDWALSELLHELDKQVLDDGADFEASTGYHRFVLELLLYSFILCERNGVEIEGRYWNKLQLMLRYLQSYLRPDGFAPLFGDTDSGRVLPVARRAANDHSYLLGLGMLALHQEERPESFPLTEELTWIFGSEGVERYQALPARGYDHESTHFPNAGTYILRKDDLYLALNTSGAGGGGRGSHGHNDSLSVEISAFGRAFIVDPGSFVYTADLIERHLFRSTAYHSTLQVDNEEQNSTYESVPFVIGDEAHPKVLRWETKKQRDVVVAEHYGYNRLADPIAHKRTVVFDKEARFWLIEDELRGSGRHSIAARFHFDSDLEVSVHDQTTVTACDKITRARLSVCGLDLQVQPQLEENFVSKDYGSKQPSVSVCWAANIEGQCTFRWIIVPVSLEEDELERIAYVRSRI